MFGFDQSNFPLTTPYSHIVKREVTARNDTDSDRNTGSTPFSSRSSETMDVRAELTAFDGPLKVVTNTHFNAYHFTEFL